VWERLQGCSLLDVFRSCYQYHDPAVLFDDGTIGPATVRFFRACGDYAPVSHPVVSNHFLRSMSERPGHRPHPPGFVPTNGDEPPGLPPCGACAGGLAECDYCSDCMSVSVVCHYGIIAPGGVVSETVEVFFRCLDGRQYLPSVKFVDALGFELRSVTFDEGAVTSTWTFRDPNGRDFEFVSDPADGTCPNCFWEGEFVDPFPAFAPGLLVILGIKQ